MRNLKLSLNDIFDICIRLSDYHYRVEVWLMLLNDSHRNQSFFLPTIFHSISKKNYKRHNWFTTKKMFFRKPQVWRLLCFYVFTDLERMSIILTKWAYVFAGSKTWHHGFDPSLVSGNRNSCSYFSNVVTRIFDSIILRMFFIFILISNGYTIYCKNVYL